MYGRKLTNQQEGFCQSIVEDKLNQADCYRANYNTSKMLRQSVDQLASRLANHVKIRSRVAELREPVASALMATRIWTAEQVVGEAETNLAGAREDHSWAPANMAVEIIARLTGNLGPVQSRGSETPITQIVIVAPNVQPSKKRSDDGELGVRRRVVDAQGYTVRPSGDKGRTEA